MGLLDIDETKKDDKIKENYPEESSYNIRDPFMPNPVLKQTLQMQEELKRIEEERKSEEEKRKKLNDNRSSSGSLLEALELSEEVKEPIINDFVRSSNKENFPVIVNNRLSLLTGNTIDLVDNLVKRDYQLLNSQISILEEFADREQLEKPFILPETPFYSGDFSKIKITTARELFVSIKLLEQSVEFVEQLIETNMTPELNNELILLTHILKEFQSGYNYLYINSNYYLKLKGDVNR